MMCANNHTLKATKIAFCKIVSDTFIAAVFFIDGLHDVNHSESDADFVGIPSGHIRQADISLLQDSIQPHTRKGAPKTTPPQPNGRLPTAQGGPPEIPKHETEKKPESGQNFPATDSGFLMCYETAKPRYETHAGA